MTLGHDRAPYSINDATEANIEATMTESVRAMFEAASAMRTG